MLHFAIKVFLLHLAKIILVEEQNDLESSLNFFHVFFFLFVNSSG